MASKKIKIPDINAYSQFHSFLHDFFDINKQSNKNFSFRFLARNLGWSASHLNDVLQGRRFLSLNKILEFIEYLGLKGVKAERLLLLALFESNGLSEKGKDFLVERNSSLNVQTMTQDEASILSGSIRMQEVLHYLISRDGIWDVADFIARSRKPKELQKSELNKIIQQLENGKMIRWDKGKYIIEKTEFYQDTTNTEGIFHAAQKAYAKGYQDFLDDRYAPWTDLFGTVLIPRDRLPEVYDRLAGIRNYLYEIRGQTLLKDPNAKFEVFQFSINLFSVFRRNLTK